ncbi:trehalose-phosphatase [Desulfallas sp. Bu1-1]|uniref:trehalose-phosphatase n=1 Tax=Desulfallas sp. Bu1-1 TaxID=2787620 RepID=UPI00189FDE91|nr:trehalose-phosphatase [Desulfallas sp. Bu1-1]MBF7083449.1 trehalose-phosphatase [Desulfallas sp. Bu1-1]
MPSNSRMVKTRTKQPSLVAPRALAAMLGGMKRIFLFFDYDGTLVPIAPTPGEARPDPQLVRLVGALATTPEIRVALVSGRDLAGLAGMFPVPGLYLAGGHGAELQIPGAAGVLSLAPEATPAPAELAAALRPVLAGRPGFWLEEKKYSLALHYRLADPGETPAVLKAFREAARGLARTYGLTFLSGKKVLEICPRSVHKGNAVLRLWDEFPDALPVYLGDDITDEHAFAALAGRGITVLVAQEPRASMARYRLRNPGEVRVFVRCLLSEIATVVPGANRNKSH